MHMHDRQYASGSTELPFAERGARTDAFARHVDVHLTNNGSTFDFGVL
jgi:hypothetical protein